METKRNETELEQLPQENSSDSQTDLESENSEARMPEDGVEGEELGTVSQTETEAEEKPRRSRRTRTPKSESDTEEKEVKTTTRRKRANTRTAVNVLSIDEHRTVETEADKARNDLLDLIESMKTQKILTGTIQGVEQPEDNPSRSLAVIYHGDFKVIIPAEEAVLPPEDNRGRSQEDVMHYTLTKRLGAEVDYIVKGIDPQSGVAVASRLEAMAAKRKEYYFGTDRDGNNILYEGVCAEARIVSVIRAGIFVDLFGLEIYIPLRELSYQRLLDASSQFQPGQRVLVKILSIDRSDRNHIKASASVKQAGENPYPEQQGV